MDIIKTVDLLDGRVISIPVARGMHFARASYRQQCQKEIDIVPFLMSEICLLEGVHQTEGFYLNLLCDDYMKILEALAETVTIIR